MCVFIYVRTGARVDQLVQSQPHYSGTDISGVCRTVLRWSIESAYIKRPVLSI